MTTSKLSRSAVPGVWSVYAATAVVAACLSTAAVPAQAEIIVRGIEGKPLHEARPAPAFLKPDVNIIVAQPAPSDFNPSFLGPVLLMRQAHVDLEKGTATLPLRKGKLRSGELVWFVLTDTTDADLANLHGLVYAPKMAYGLTGKGSREATIERDGTFTFEAGKVDFSPDRSVTPFDRGQRSAGRDARRCNIRQGTRRSAVRARGRVAGRIGRTDLCFRQRPDRPR